MLTQTKLKELLNYCPETGIFTWKVITSNRARLDCPAGNLTSHGYIRISVLGNVYYAHRLAWLYVHGEFPKNEIDHINRVTTDNRIDNIRLATHNQNLRNLSKKKNNKSGYIGVSWAKREHKWEAYCTHKGKRYSLGYFNTAENASNTYQKFSKTVFGEFHHGIT